MPTHLQSHSDGEDASLRARSREGERAAPAYGADLSRYQVIPRVLLVITHGERVLLLRRSAHKKLWPGQYNAPGGHVERGEEPYEAALRELAEETGVQPGPLRLVGLILNETGLAQAGILVFVFQGEAAESALRPSAEGMPAWVARAELAALPVVPDVPDVLALVLDQPDFFYLYKTPTAEGEIVRQRLSQGQRG